MHSELADFIKGTPEGREAKDIINSCVHCGFCNATCPTYQLQGNELDGPRGRIYLLKNFLEGQAIGHATQQYLDRCLSCGACETTCPSGVKFTRLADIGRNVLAEKLPRPWRQRLFRRLLLSLLPYPRRFAALIACARLLRPVLPQAIARKLPAKQCRPNWPLPKHARRMLILQGCVQPVLAPRIDSSAAQVLSKLGISAIAAPVASCCGALNHHLADQQQSLKLIRQNIDNWWPLVAQGVEALIVTASGCALMVKQYGELLAHDLDYAEKAARIAGLVQDMSEILMTEDLSALTPNPRTIAFQSPCSLQHGLALNGAVEQLLMKLGFTLSPVEGGHLCCGSAGTYSLLQPQISRQLREQKLAALQAHQPGLIATANIGCLLHLQEQAQVPVVHWLELLDGKG